MKKIIYVVAIAALLGLSGCATKKDHSISAKNDYHGAFYKQGVVTKTNRIVLNDDRDLATTGEDFKKSDKNEKNKSTMKEISDIFNSAVASFNEGKEVKAWSLEIQSGKNKYTAFVEKRIKPKTKVEFVTEQDGFVSEVIEEEL
jgi:hypothetical protein